MTQEAMGIGAIRRRTELEMLHTADSMFDAAAEHLGLEPGMIELLRYPKRQLAVSLPVQMDDGTVRRFEGFRVQHHPVLGPCKGGVRYHPNVTLAEVQALAILMTWKTAIAGLPFSGAKGAIVCDPKALSAGELERLTRRYTTEIGCILGPHRDIPAPDVSTSSREMAWMLDTLSMHEDRVMLGSVTGKPILLGGSEGRETATARGGFFCTLRAMRHLGMAIEHTNAAVQGFGNAGYHMALCLHEAGANVVAVSDSTGAIYSSRGIDPRAVRRHKDEHGSVRGFPEAEEIEQDALLELDCHLLVPAALENQLREDNADRVRARLIVELANGPTTREAGAILTDKGRFVVPDVLANAGGVVVSYFEWVQDRSSLFWSAAEVDSRLEATMGSAFERVFDRSQKAGVDMRLAAYATGIGRVAEAARLRGFYP